MTSDRLALDRARRRLLDIKESIHAINRHLSGRTSGELNADLIARLAFERLLEIVSEASRHLPDGWKAEHASIPWRQVADLGNSLRHAYQRIELQPLWDIYERELEPLERAVDAMLAAHPPMEESL